MKNIKKFPSKYAIRFLVRLVFAVFTKLFRIKKNMPVEVQKLKPPYLVLGNHVGYWDPFIMGYFLPYFTHFISSDTTLRSPIIRFFITRLGTIPIKKNRRDTKAIRGIISVIKQGENVGIFPEALRSWTGSNFKIDASIVKLIKFLKVPVVVPVIKGMSLFNPRWSTRLRYTRVEVDYKLVFTTDTLEQLSHNEIYEKLNAALYHDEVAYQQKRMQKIFSLNKAQHIGHALYVCPSCHAIDSFRAVRNDFSCADCHYDIHIDKYGFYKRISKGKLFFDNIRDWYNWEEIWLLKHVDNKFDAKSMDVIFEDKNSKFFYSSSDGKMDFIDTVNLKLYIDKIEIESLSGKKEIILNFDDLQTINPQINERIEIYYADEAYRFVGGRSGVSGLKWEVAVNALWKKLGQNHKLSVYIEQTL
ncbi:MAG: 1-acyl-sn-glycerol-3-phosphate acyltransferase [Flavobacteriaceae bacterium]|nr:1-acyl-sn-glycerol-3-phosphate acyltransferase [Flavobacteriaceae bacterium]